MIYTMKLFRFRNSVTKPTLGTIAAFEDGNLVCDVDTLELPWKWNKRNVSCIPSAIYKIKKRYTVKRGWHFQILNVPDRSWILIHVANYSRNILGCIAPGITHADIDSDGELDVTSSRVALNKLLDAVKTDKEFEIEIL